MSCIVKMKSLSKNNIYFVIKILYYISKIFRNRSFSDTACKEGISRMKNVLIERFGE
jgi:hypothetical protein